MRSFKRILTGQLSGASGDETGLPDCCEVGLFPAQLIDGFRGTEVVGRVCWQVVFDLRKGYLTIVG